MSEHLIRKFMQFTKLSNSDRGVILAMCDEKRRFVGQGEDIIREGDEPAYVNLILDGWACRYNQLRDDRRQIISFLLPGDLCDTHVSVLREMDHSIGALTPVTFAQISRETLARVTAEHPRITQALWWDTLVTAAIQRKWTANLGQRTAAGRIGHLLCEIFIRLRGVGLTEGNGCVLPVTQTDLASALGLSSVHINRTLQEMRSSGLIVLKGRQLTIPSLAALQRASLFQPNYLHLDRVGRHLDASEATE